ncbi:YdeI/OmpD-associated family protein [Paraglaciecola marina]|uniref:YdeI/OmpD-associated family protein n=1 Tax=Paraglaciecola marina TaxID=2500157 RepID=UPI001EEF8628|nr:YdeI/OmpD-associated family protein [Paraglaciecola marina]
MPTPTPSKIMTFATPEALNTWLWQNYATETELWVKIFKKHTKVQSVTWNDVVVEALCWGWIDGIKKSLDDQTYLQRITPRLPRSNWSKRNTEHVEHLIATGRMMEPGLIHVRTAKADGRWDEAYVVSKMEIPEDFIAALDTQPNAKSFYDTLNKSHRNTIAYGLTSAKKPETRQRRFTKFITMLTNKEKP